uniref:Nudix hydrolase domain-containing protein n=1 Tax=Leersia perrieri TaxID=77586 RepID=A0A0D9WBE9_9ORYZ
MVAVARCFCFTPILTPILTSTPRHRRLIPSSSLRLSLPPPPPLSFRCSCSRSASPLAVVASMEAPPQGYRTNIFAASRIDIPNTWQMPQGGIDAGEEPNEAAVRELREETGVTSAEMVAEVPVWLTYDFPLDVKDKLNSRWGTSWKGQAQKWFLFRLTGEEDEINLNGDGSERPEFCEWTWMTPQQVIEKAVDFKKPVYEEAMKHFAPYLQSDPATSS